MDKKEKGFSAFMRASIAYYLKLIKLFFVSLKKMWYLPLLGLLLVAYIWFVAFKSNLNGFEGRAIYPYNYLDKQFYVMLFDELEQEVESKDYETIAKKLNLNQNVVQDIITLKAENYNGTSFGQKEEVEGTIFLYTNLKSKTHSDKIAQSILTYLNNHKYVTEKVSEFLELTSKKIEFLDKEIEMLNSLKKNQNSFETSEASGGTNMAQLFEISNEKFQEREDLVKILKNKKAVELFAGFKLKPISSKKGYKKKTLYSLFVLGFMSFLAFFIFWYKNPTSFEE